MDRPLCYLNTGKSNALNVISAFAAGSGAEITTRLEFQPGRTAVFWGVDRVTLPLWRKVLDTKTPYVYLDNGYFCPKSKGGDYYRITRNAEQCSGRGSSDGKRWASLGLKIDPWTMAGDHVLVACNTDFWHERHGDGSAEKFAAKVVSELKQRTRRPVIVRRKPIHGVTEPPLAGQLRNCWAVVTYSSMVAADGLLVGVPAFMLGPSALESVAGRELAEIEAPFWPGDRERCAGVLADNQWTLSEIRNGTAWRTMNANT